MREIKFRAWDRKTSKWLYNSNVDGCNILGETIIMGGWMYEIRLENLNDIIVDQYTGLHDKNGKEIYEGDIVRLKNWEPSDMQISFIEGAFCLSDLKTGEYVGDIHYVQHAGVQQSEVIGNIHESK